VYPTGPLLPEDESLTHQIADTFARVSQSDRSWTEKVWAMGAARDGSMSVAFGLGKYPNRNVMDGFAGVSRGTEQWTVRASRRLAPDPSSTSVGPLRYDVTAPLRTTTYALDATDVQPIAFELEVTSVVPPQVEDREVHVSRSRYRIDADVVRFHQAGTARGWVEVDGARMEVSDDTWVGARDRSWGVRYGVGHPPEDIESTPAPPGTSTFVVWMPVAMVDAGGRPSTLFAYLQRHHGEGWAVERTQGALELPDGRRRRFSSVEPDLRFEDANRRLLGGDLVCTDERGEQHTYRVQPLSDTGFHLGTGLYGGWGGHVHGEFRGELHVEGEHVTDCHLPEVARRIHQHRDCVVEVRDGHGARGVGTLQSIVVGEHPAMGLTAAMSFE